MNWRDVPIDGYVLAWLKQDIVDFPAGDEDFRVFGVAADFLRQFVDRDWGNQIVFGGHTPVDRRHLDDRKYMRVARTDDADGIRNQQRTVRIVELILSLRAIEGVDRRIEELKHGSIETVIAELESGLHLMRRNIPFEYVTPSGEKGADFDALIKWPGVASAPCEMKCKVESTDLSSAGIHNALEKARKQLPKSGHGIVFLKIPEEWTRDSNVVTSVREAIEAFYRQTRRVVAIVIRWEEVRSMPGGGHGVLYRYRIERSPHNGSDVALDSLIARLEGAVTQQSVSIRTLVRDALTAMS